MIIEIIQAGRVLRTIHYNGQMYIEAPPVGTYEVRLTNNSPQRRMAVMSVDGVNVINGKSAGYDGPGYVFSPWQSYAIKGWRRTSSEVASFTFEASEGSYAAQTGRGTKNTGVIGLAVFNEKPNIFFQTPITIYSTTTMDSNSSWHNPRGIPINAAHEEADTSRGISCNATSTMGRECSVQTASTKTVRRSVTRGTNGRFQGQDAVASASPSPAPTLGTGYGSQTSQYTMETTFERASTTPALIVQAHYATTEKLREWGVPVDAPFAPVAPDPFPASGGAHVPAPPGWRG